eukprot:14241697-Heterocapsa_arctica.AAC.1
MTDCSGDSPFCDSADDVGPSEPNKATSDVGPSEPSKVTNDHTASSEPASYSGNGRSLARQAGSRSSS